MPNAAARREISLPIPPRPITSSVLPINSSRTTPGPLERHSWLGCDTDEVRQAASEREQVTDCLIGDLWGISALHVGQDDVAVHELRDLHQMFDPCAGLLDPPERLAGVYDPRSNESIACVGVDNSLDGFVFVPALYQLRPGRGRPERDKLFCIHFWDDHFEPLRRLGPGGGRWGEACHGGRGGDEGSTIHDFGLRSRKMATSFRVVGIPLEFQGIQTPTNSTNSLVGAIGQHIHSRSLGAV